MIVALGLIVGFIVIAMFMPLIAIVSQLSSGNDSAGCVSALLTTDEHGWTRL